MHDTTTVCYILLRTPVFEKLSSWKRRLKKKLGPHAADHSIYFPQKKENDIKNLRQ